jgi:hypothetical protein
MLNPGGMTRVKPRRFLYRRESLSLFPSGLGSCRVFDKGPVLPVTLDGSRGVTGCQQRIAMVASYLPPLLSLSAYLGELFGGLFNVVAALEGPFAPHEIRQTAVGGAIAL